jgi:protein-disulfide isomerase
VNRNTFLKVVCSIALAVVIAAPTMLGAPGGKEVPVGDLTANKSMGSRQAPITIEVFADFQCPQCRNFYLTTTRQLIDNYVATGKVFLVHHDFPLSMHTYSHQAARWASAAATLGPSVFETVEQALYSHQDEWGATGNIQPILAAVVSPADMKRIQLVETTQAAELDAAVARDMALGNSRHVDATPSIFVTHNGQTTALPPGGVDYKLLKQYLDYLLQH